MSGSKLFLDTNIILYLLNGDTDIRDILNEKQLYISFISELELLGFKDITKSERDKAIDFLKECTIIDIHPSIKTKVVEIRSKHKIKLPDAIIAATAYHLDIQLFTADKGLSVVSDMSILLYTK